MDEKLTVRAVERALDIMLCFTESTELGLTEIAAITELHKSTVHRLLASLEGRGFVIRDPGNEKYRLGFRIWELSAQMSRSNDPAILLLPEMEWLRDQLGETVSLYLRDGHERIRIQAVQSNESIRRVAPVGVRLPLYLGASSKVLLAFEEAAVEQELLARADWPAQVDRQQLALQLADIRRSGYATSVEERETGAAAVAAPVYNRGRKLAAALSVSGPANRLTLDKMREQAPLIIETARRMGKMLE